MKQWIVFNFLFLIFLVISIFSFNYWIDPLWCFEHKNSLQAHQEGFNERQQKINLIHFNPDFNYDALILGSSRVTIHNSHLIKSVKTFNLAINGMQPYEFNDYIEYAKRKNQKDFKYIILGLDFSSLGNSAQPSKIDSYIKITNIPLYRYKTLLSYDTLNISLKNFRNTAFGKYKKRFKTYDQNYIAYAYQKDPESVKNSIQNSLLNLKNPDINYQRSEYLQILNQLKKNNPHTQFIIFTTPLPEPLMTKMLLSSHNRQVYTLWLLDLVNTFGSAYHFFYLNNVTKNYTSTFVDEGHYTSEVGNCIDEKLFNHTCKDDKYNDFGIIINQYNISKIISVSGLSNVIQ